MLLDQVQLSPTLAEQIFWREVMMELYMNFTIQLSAGTAILKEWTDLET